MLAPAYSWKKKENKKRRRWGETSNTPGYNSAFLKTMKEISHRTGREVEKKKGREKEKKGPATSHRYLQQDNCQGKKKGKKKEEEKKEEEKEKKSAATKSAEVFYRSR